MECPICHAALRQLEDKNPPAQQCPAGCGYAIAERLRVPGGAPHGQPGETPEPQALREGRAETETQLQCPMCLIRPMERREAPLRCPAGEVLSTHACTHCNLVWLDRGELARLQFDYKAAVKTLDEFETRQRVERLTQAENERLARELAELPLPKGFLAEVVADLGRDPRFLVGVLAAAVIIGLLIWLYFAVN